jgi:hypothetical protein
MERDIRPFVKRNVSKIIFLSALGYSAAEGYHIYQDLQKVNTILNDTTQPIEDRDAQAYRLNQRAATEGSVFLGLIFIGASAWEVNRAKKSEIANQEYVRQFVGRK